MIKNITDTMTNFSSIEPIIIVGIGYKMQELSRQNSKSFWKNCAENRAHDYISTCNQEQIEILKNQDEYKSIKTFFCGKKFTNFIENELIRYTNKSYRSSNDNSLF